MSSQAVDEELEPSEEERLLWKWRYQAAVREGLGHFDAQAFADEGIDSHALTDLIKRGCDPATALRILL